MQLQFYNTTVPI